MKCINCGAPLEDENAIFCEKCYKENVAKNAGDTTAAPEGEKRPKKKKNKKKIILGILLSIVAVLLAAVIAVVCWLNSLLDKPQKENLSGDLGIVSKEELPFDEEVKNIALFGLDTRQDNDRGRSDAIIVLSIDRVNKKVKMSSIARDTYITYANGKHDKITHAWSNGKQNLAVKTLNRNFKLDITDFVSVNFFQFAYIIDYIGGVTIDINEGEMNVMNNKHIPHIQSLGIKCEKIKAPGVQHVGGGEALAYARDRYTGSDIERGSRQREVLAAMFEAVKKMNVLKLPKLVEMILGECTTSLDKSEMISIGTWALFNMPQIESFGLPNEECKGRGQMINGTSYMVYDLDHASQMLHDFIYQPAKLEETSSSAAISETTKK